MASSQNSGKTHAVYITLICLLVAAAAALAVVYMNQNSQLEKANNQIVAERDSLTQRLNDMLWEYETVKTTDQDVKKELEVEKAKIVALMNKMKHNDNVNYAAIRDYEKQINTLTNIMRSYIKQIDSLNLLSRQLLAENMEVKQSLYETQEENQKLAEEKNSLFAQVEKGSALKIREITAEGLNSRDKSTKSASKTKKVKACFTINENSIARTGTRIAYLRVLGSDQKVLTTADDNTFDVKGELLPYSAKREVDYQSQELETCVYFDVKDLKLQKGKHEVQIFIDDENVGTGEFLLK